MKVVFMGTPEFAGTALRAIISHGDEIALVVTRADKPKGRGYVLTPSPVKELAMQYGIPVITPATLRDAEVQKVLRGVNADVFIVAAYGKILPQEVLDMPRLGCINIHASLLPELRGAAPINRAIMRGDAVGGITIMYMDAGLDTGDIILQKSMEIPPEMNAGEYHDAMADLGGKAICEYLDAAAKGTVPRTKQPDGSFSYADKIDKSEAAIDFNKSNKDIHNLIRGLAPFPCAYAMYKGRRIKFCAAVLCDKSGAAGTTLSADSDGIVIACSKGSIRVTEVQPEGKGRMTADQFLRGNRVTSGEVWA